MLTATAWQIAIADDPRIRTMRRLHPTTTEARRHEDEMTTTTTTERLRVDGETVTETGIAITTTTMNRPAHAADATRQMWSTDPTLFRR